MANLIKNFTNASKISIQLQYIVKFIAFAILLQCAQCNRKKDPAPNQEKGSDYTLLRTQASPFQAIGIIFKESQDFTEITATIGSVKIPLKSVNDTLFTFMVPETLSPGKYDFTIENITKSTTITINPYNTISSPKEYYREFNEQTNSQLQKFISAQKLLIERGVATPEESNLIYNEIQRQLSIGAEAFASSSEEQQKRTVQFISANRGALDSLAMVLNEIQISEKSGRITTPCEPKQYSSYCRCMARQVLVTGAILAVSLQAIFVVPDPLLKLAVGGVVFLALKEFEAILKNNLRLPSIYDGGNAERLNLSPHADTFLNGVPNSIQFKIPVRSFQSDLDKDSPIDEYRKLSQALTEIKGWNKLLAGIFTIDVADIPVTKGYTYPDEPSLLKVDVLNNRNVIASVPKIKDQMLEIAFTTLGASDETFDYKITYVYNGVDISKVYSGATIKLAKTPLIIVGSTSEPITSAGETYTSYIFTVSSSEWQPNDKTQFVWDMGDGSEKKTVIGNPDISYYYKTAGKFNISVTVFDGSEPVGTTNAQCEIQLRTRKLYTRVYFTANGKEYKSEKNGDFFSSVQDKVYAIGGWCDGVEIGDICTIDFSIPHSKFRGAGTYDLRTDVSVDLSIKEERMCHGIYDSFRSPYASGKLVITSYENNIIEATFEFVISPMPGTKYDDHEHTEVISVKNGRIIGPLTDLSR